MRVVRVAGVLSASLFALSPPVFADYVIDVSAVSGGGAYQSTETNGATTLQASSSFGTQSAFASVDLASATLRVEALSPDELYGAAAHAEFFDTVSFDLTGLADTDFVSVVLGASIEGTYEAFAEPDFALVAWTTSGVFDEFAAVVGYRASTEGVTFSTSNPEQFLTDMWGDFDTFGPAAFYGIVTLQGGDVRGMAIEANLWGDSSVRFGNSVTLQLITSLPFTSDSGVLFSTPVVPLPAAAWLFVSGLLGLFGVRHRKRSAPSMIRGALNSLA